ncbi:MAG: branched-chain amino acid ABC transporter permease [Bradyrhizobium sp.]
MNFFLTLVLTGISVGSVYALIATGLNLTFWTTRTLNFGQGSIMMLCSLGFAFLVAGSVSLGVAFCLCLLIAGAIGIVVDRLTVRPALKRGGGSMGWVVSTLGFGIFLQGLAAKFFGSQAVAFPEILFSVRDSIRIGGVALSLQYLVVIVVTLVILLGLELFLRRTQWGHAVRAVSEDAELARVQGIPVDAIVGISFVASSLLAGLAGLLAAQIGGTVDSSFGFDLVLLGFVAGVLGGMGSSAGALAGGIGLGIITKLVGGYISTAAEHGIAFALLMLILALLPNGFFGRSEVRRA